MWGCNDVLRVRELAGGCGRSRDLRPQVKSYGERLMASVGNSTHDLTCAVGAVSDRLVADALWLVGGTAMKKLRIVILGFGTARQKRVLE
jgi:hypothetical protein